MAKTKAKGYRPSERANRKTMDIQFAADHEFAGAEVTAGLAASLDLVVEIQTMTDAGVERQRELIREFGDLCLVSWNIEDRRGVPVPANGAGLVAQDMAFVQALLEAWIEVMTQPSAPLPVPSSNGSKSAAP